MIGFLNHVISTISLVLKEITLTISVSTGEAFVMESEIVRVVSLSTTEKSIITRLNIFRVGYLNRTSHNILFKPMAGHIPIFEAMFSCEERTNPITMTI